MKARVIEISERSIYLEVDHQIRFRSGYCPLPTIHPSAHDQIEFHFDRQCGQTLVAIDAVAYAKRSETPRRR